MQGSNVEWGSKSTSKKGAMAAAKRPSQLRQRPQTINESVGKTLNNSEVGFLEMEI
jgi:hypothetical protein